MSSTPSFIFAMLSRLIIPCVSGKSGQCKLMTSLLAKSSFKVTICAVSSPGARASYASTSMPKAAANFAVALPMRP